MSNPIHSLLRHHKAVIAAFIIASILSLFSMLAVSVNFNLVDYLPDSAPSTIALDVMYEEFSAASPNLRVFIPNTSIPAALSFKQILLDCTFIDSVLWLDDFYDIKQPLQFAPSATVESWFKDGGALFMLSINDSLSASDALAQLRLLLPHDAAFDGDAANSAAAQDTVKGEVSRIMLVVVPLILLILLVATNSWFSPLLFGIVILSSILLNMGSNLIFGEISFLTQTVAPILQLAVSMDYSIFLLNRFDKFKLEGLDAHSAMARAVKDTVSTVLASGATTFIGFLVLCLMEFKIGPDLGLVLAKGILFSIISSLLLLPCVTLACNKLIDKTSHKPILPSFLKFSKFASRLRIPALILVILFILPAFLAQGSNNFTYGTSNVGDGSRYALDSNLINDKFGASSQLILLLPRGNFSAEALLSSQLKTLDGVSDISSYVDSVGIAIPPDFLSPSQRSAFLSDSFSRFIITVSTPSEGESAFRLVQQIRSAANYLYDDNFHLCGISVNNYDMKLTVERDNTFINIAAIIAIFVVLLLTFRSISLPFILLITIETAIWINLAIPYFFSDNPMHYIAYLIVNTVQLGATIDYAIHLTDNYRAHRSSLAKDHAALLAVSDSTPSILVSALIMSLSGISLSIMSANFIVSEFGLILARGAALSALLVLTLLPALLVLLDKLTLISTLNHIKKG